MDDDGVYTGMNAATLRAIERGAVQEEESSGTPSDEEPEGSREHPGHLT